MQVFIYFLMHFFVAWKLNAEHSFVTKKEKNIPSTYSQVFSPLFLCRSQNISLSHVRFWSLRFNAAVKMNQTQQLEWHIFMCLPGDLQQLPRCCMSSFPCVRLAVLYFRLKTAACIPLSQEYSVVIWHSWGQMAACTSHSSVFVLQTAQLWRECRKQLGLKLASEFYFEYFNLSLV